MSNLLVPKTIRNKTEQEWSKVEPVKWKDFDDIYSRWEQAEMKQLAELMDQQVRESLRKK
jgi:hypothetical protein